MSAHDETVPGMKFVSIGLAVCGAIFVLVAGGFFCRIVVGLFKIGWRAAGVIF